MKSKLYVPPTKEQKYDKAMIMTAYIWQKESKCNRLKVGAILAKDGRIIMNGYNGTVAGQDNCCEEDPYVDPQKTTTKQDVVHAEHNVLISCEHNEIPTEGTTLYITHNPCVPCAMMVLEAKITRVVYSEYYRDLEGIKLLKNKKVQVDRFLFDLVQ
jgi:dCMP deaminase